MFFVYILQSLKSGRFYVGQTHDLNKRLEEHNSDQAGHTKKEQPWKILWQQQVNARADALALERKIKKRGAKRFLQDSSIIKPG
ncbi:MAG: GIY-YIG nuclease family protein [Cyclobacteriaceae bacterium]|nr:GIY-YIG nuclease family protein [Cyclobacteriaceae bacterium]MCK6616579.1 GIY-YIG nuclease family protein [Cyclobacteriaceae bacterium]